MFNKKKLGLLAATFTLGLVIAGCGADDNQQVEEVDIGYFPNLDHAAGIVSKEEGIMQDNLGSEITANFRNFPNGNQFIEALDNGQIDMGYVGPGPAINYYLQGGDVTILGAAANGATLIVSNEGSDIKDLEDFDGKHFGSPGNGCTHNVQLEIMLQELGLTSERVGGTVKHQSGVDPANSALMFDQDQMDAYTAPEPWGTYMVEEHNANVVAEWDEVFLGETLPSVVLVTSNDFLENHPEVVEQVMKGHLESVEFAQENKEKTLSLANDLIYELSQNKLPEEVLMKSWERFEVTEQIHPQSLEDWADASYELEFLLEEPDIDGLINTEILDNLTE
ncbi:aliphatic sulfonate ABC transporter substrate-binding protein [Natranaerobius trueperi]|uniref:ABC transporter substrate-binding protein n=1 Tax=Natranaerobius trueperi TaxID=759412 RepID=A0A226BV74_9FIRM|nr:aliphatic sulfonate ABC transporter substrate-binding protein [Natranaerobius trueperi]OWZ82896.1 ABC transporter substrate-binding protein [Natranaerobius trueperi]